MSQYFFQTIRARVRNPYLPVDISTRLPLHLTRIVGIQCRYCSGIERIRPAIAAEIIPRIGWFTLAVNNRKRPLAKAQKLGAKLLKAFDEIPKEDAYRAELTAAAKAIGRYVKGDSATVDIPVATLHGLGSIAIGSIAGGLGEVVNQQNVLALANHTVGSKRDAASLKRAFRNTANPSLCYDLASALLRRNSGAQKAVGQPRLTVGDHDGGIAGLEIIDWKLSNAQDTQIAGLGSVTDKTLIGTPAAKSILPAVVVQTAVKPITAQDLAKMQFKTIGYNGRFKDVVGDPAIGFHMMVYGKPFQGKSSFVIELCKDLAALNKGRIAYLALEEGISASMQKKVIDRGAANVSGLDFIGGMLPSFDGYRFVVIDSVSDRSLKREALRELFLQNPEVCFICIFHATKEGTARGGLDYSHDMDIILKINSHEPHVEKNRFL